MKNLSEKQKQEILDCFGQKVIESVRDDVLKYSMDIVKRKTVNQITLKNYATLAYLTEEQQESVCDLLSEIITITIYNFLEMFEENADKMELIVKKDGEAYDLTKVSEKMGSEIACFEEDGWIQKFSKIGRFVL